MRTRLVEVADAQALMNIYNPEVIETTFSFDLVPRTLTEQEEWIRTHLATHPCIVAVNEDDGLGETGARGEKILGFALVSPFRQRPAYATTVENSVYVHRRARGRGVGEVLLRELIQTAQESGFHSLIARIVGENDGSIRLHEKCGFHLVGTEIEVGRKHGRWLDVVEYQYVVPDQRS
jgi:L-amino acid N-acyltransferase YncA